MCKAQSRAVRFVAAMFVRALGLPAHGDYVITRSAAVPRRFLVCAGCTLALFLATAPAHGWLILDPGSYVLRDHPDGSQGPSTYGLRLDELINVTAGHDVFTDITEAGTDAFELHIYRTAFGGLIHNQQYDALISGVAYLDFVYMIANSVDGDHDLIVTTPNFWNTGVITFASKTLDPFDRANTEDFTLRLGDENDDPGHGGFDGISGWGGLDHGTAGTHAYSSDWNFTVVPTPGSAALLTMAFAIFARGKRRRLVPSTQAVSYLPERRAMLRTAVLGREKHADPNMPAACFSLIGRLILGGRP